MEMFTHEGLCYLLNCKEIMYEIVDTDGKLKDKFRIKDLARLFWLASKRHDEICEHIIIELDLMRAYLEWKETM